MNKKKFFYTDDHFLICFIMHFAQKSVKIKNNDKKKPKNSPRRKFYSESFDNMIDFLKTRNFLLTNK